MRKLWLCLTALYILIASGCTQQASLPPKIIKPTPLSASPTAPPAAIPTPTIPQPTPLPFASAVPLDASMLLYGVTELSVKYSYAGDFPDDYVPYKTSDPYLLALFISGMSNAEQVPQGVFDEANRMNKQAASLMITIDGEINEITCAIDTLYEVCAYAYDGRYYRPSFEMGRFIMNLEQYRPLSGRIPSDVSALLVEYDWTAAYLHATIPVTLPQNLLMKMDEYPDKLYWSHNLILSQQIGMDFTPYLGTQVTAEMYRLIEPAAMEGRADFNADAVILRTDTGMVSAFISRGRHYAFSTALDRSEFVDITGKEISDWFAENGYDTTDPEYLRIAKLPPEEVIEAYINAWDENDNSVFNYTTARTMIQSLFSNMPDSALYNERRGGAVVNSARVLSIQEMQTEDDDDKNSYSVQWEIEAEASELSDAYSGVSGAIYTMKHGAAGWKIDSIGN